MVNLRVSVIALCVALIAHAGSREPARAHDLHACRPYALLVTQAKAALAEANNGAQLAEFSGEQARKLIEVINSRPPVTDFVGDAAAAVMFEDGDATVIVASKGCALGAMRFDKTAWDSIVKQAMGDGA